MGPGGSGGGEGGRGNYGGRGGGGKCKEGWSGRGREREERKRRYWSEKRQGEELGSGSGGGGDITRGGIGGGGEWTEGRRRDKEEEVGLVERGKKGKRLHFSLFSRSSEPFLH